MPVVFPTRTTVQSGGLAGDRGERKGSSDRGHLPRLQGKYIVAAIADRGQRKGGGLRMNREFSHLKRSDSIWINNPIFFIMTCTDDRENILTNASIAKILIKEWKSAKEHHGWYVGRYVIMPNHVHYFCTPRSEAKDLSQFMKFWKEWTSKKIKKVNHMQSNIWQPEFFDHLLRSEESYDQKWEYVFNNPVHAGLVNEANE